MANGDWQTGTDLVNVLQDVFTDSTPNGEIEFVNLVATFDIEAPTKLVLAAHYDSKWFDSFPENQVGQVLHLAHLHSQLNPLVSHPVYWRNGFSCTVCDVA